MSNLVTHPVLAAIHTRRSIRRYRPEPIARDVIDMVLQAATWAPSAHNRQPWRFAVLCAPETRARLAAAMGARLRADRLADGDPPLAVEADVARSTARLCAAPVLVLACLTLAGMDRYPDARRAGAERVMAVQSTAMALQNLLLAAHALGLASCSLCAPLFCGETVRETLALPCDWEPQALVTLGWPAATPTRERVPLAERVVYVDECA